MQRKKIENAVIEKTPKACSLNVDKPLSELIFMVGVSLFDSIVKVEVIEEKMISDSLSFVILKAETKNSNGYYAGNSEYMKILVIKSESNLISVSKIYTSWADGFHSYEKFYFKVR